MTWKGSGIFGEESADGRTVRLTAPLWVPLRAGHPMASWWPRGFEIPAGFVTDFASVPWWLWWLLPPHGPYGPAAVAHDYCYRRNGMRRVLADAVLLSRMQDLGVPAWKMVLIYLGVRAGGWWTWWRYRREERRAREDTAQ